VADVQVVVDGLAFPEGPRWHDGRLWFSDMHAHVVQAFDPTTRAVETIVEVPRCPSGLGWLPDGTLLVVSMEDRSVMRYDGSTLSLHADLSAWATFHCNDMVVDDRGRAYVGNFGFDLHTQAEFKPAALVLVEPDGAARPVADELMFPNGTVITPDGSTLIVGESGGQRLTAFDIADDGSLSNRRVWAQLAAGTPDGICLDDAGTVWLASPFTNDVIRVREGGEVVETVPVERGAFACMLDDAGTLYIATAESSDPAESARLRTGRIEAVTVDARRAGSP
jgi:sugar lactone lactonase YvrE